MRIMPTIPLGRTLANTGCNTRAKQRNMKHESRAAVVPCLALLYPLLCWLLSSVLSHCLVRSLAIHDLLLGRAIHRWLLLVHNGLRLRIHDGLLCIHHGLRLGDICGLGISSCAGIGLCDCDGLPGLGNHDNTLLKWGMREEEVERKESRKHGERKR